MRARTLASTPILAALCCVLAMPGALAGPAAEPTAPAAQPAPVTDSAYTRGAIDLQTAEAFELSIQTTSAIRPNIDYELTVIRVGYMLDTPHGSNFLRGNNEFMLEAVGGPIFHGPGSALGGLSIIYRRNFLSPGAKVVPYLNLGAGGVYSDAYHDHVQQALGSMFEFDLQASVGAHFRLSPRWSIDTEFAYRHLSNAHITQRNLGTNAIGGVLGVSRSF
jgi:hypothetical protein